MAIRDDMEDVQEAVINELITENGITNTLADGQVTTAKIDDGAVTPAKLDRAYLETSGGSVSGNLLVSGKTVADRYEFAQNSSAVGMDTGIYRATSSTLAIKTNSQERMRIDSSGNVLVGTTDTSVANQTGTTQGVRIAGANNIQVASTGVAAYFNRLSTDGLIVEVRKNAVPVGGIYVTGSATAYNTSSDYRLKENVVDLTGATERLKQLEPKRFNFIADADTTVDGFLAHEVQDIVPEAITGTKDEVDADGNPEYQGIDQSKLVPLLVATIKELEARITTLEQQ